MTPPLLDRNKKSKLEYIHRVTFLHATAMFTRTKHTRRLELNPINVSSRFVQRNLKTLIYMEKLMNPQGTTVAICHQFLLFAAAFVC